jgi:hypothetical protein
VALPLLIGKMIKLLSVVGHGTNLIPHFINHYTKYVDEIQFIVYQSSIQPTLINDVKEIVKNYSNTKIVKTIEDRVFDWEKVTALYNMVKSKKPNDWWAIADIDEFHLYPDDNLKKLVDRCEEFGWDLVRGGFIDRVGENGEFVEIKEDINIFEQYPNMGFFRYPMSKACPNKICVMRGYVEITAGQHYAKINGQTTWRWQGWNHPLIHPYSFVQVHHFKWDNTAIERVKAVASVNQEYAYSDEYRLMYKELSKTKFKIDLNEPEFMFEKSDGQAKFKKYQQWDKLIKKIISI